MEHSGVVVSPRTSILIQGGVSHHQLQAASIDNSTVLFEGIRRPQNEVFDGSSIVESETSHQTGRSSSITSSIMRNGQQAIFTFISSMKDRKQRRGWKQLLLSVAYNLYILWTSVWVSTLGSFNFGEYGEWVFRALNYPITLSLDLVPYDAMVVITSLVITICFIAMLVVMFSAWGVFKASKHMEKLKNLLLFVGFFMNGLSMIFAFILTSFIECDYSKTVYFEEIDNSDYALQRFSSVRCFGNSNLTLYAFSIVAFITLCISIMATRFSFSPTWDSSLVFKPVYDWPLTFFSITNISQVFIIFFIPSQKVFGRAIVHLVMSISWFIPLFLSLPFQKSWENSIYSGIAGAKVGGAIGSLISSLTNTSVKWDFGLGMMGLTLGLIVIGFVGGIIAMEAYIRIIKRRIGQIILTQGGQYEDLSSSKESNLIKSLSNETIRSLIEKKATSILVYISEKQLTNQLNIFLRFSFSVDIIRKRATNYEEKPKDPNSSLTDTDMALALIKGAHSSRVLANPITLYFATLLVYYCMTEERATNYSLSLMTKLSRISTSLTDKIACHDLMKEINKKENKPVVAIHTDAEQLASRLDSKLKEFKALHREFFKEMMNDIVNVETLEIINTQCTAIMNDLDTAFSNRLSAFKMNKSFLRIYARYLEEVKFDSETANEFYSEAHELEEEEAANLLRKSKKAKRVEAMKTSAVGGESIAFLEGLYNNRANDKSVEVDLDDISENVLLNGVEEDPSLKRDQKFKMALAQPIGHEFNICLALCFCLLSAAFLICAAVLSLVFSDGVLADVKFVQQVCEPTVSSYAIFKQIRNQQIVLQMSQSQNSVSLQKALPQIYHEMVLSLEQSDQSVEKITELLKERVDFYVEHIEHVKLMSQGKKIGKFTPEMYDDYNGETKKLYLPTVNKRSSGYYDSFIVKNVSLSEISSILMHLVESYPSSGFNSTVDVYNFMILYLNYNSFTNAFVEICFDFIERCKVNANTFTNDYLYFFVSIGGVYVICAVSFLLYMKIFFSQIGRTLKTYEKNIKKELISNIYTELGKYTHSNSSQFLNTFNRKRNMLRYLIFIVMALASLLCASMMFAELVLNSELGYSTMLSVKQTTETLVLTQNIGFKMGELTFSNLPSSLFNSKTLFNDSALNLFKDDIRFNVTDLRSTYNDMIYGKIGVSPSILGIVPRIDEIITTKACENCSSLESIVDEFVVSCVKLNEDLMKNIYSDSQLLEKHFQIDELAHTISIVLLEFLALFTITRSTPSVSMVIVFGVLGAICIVSIFLMLRSIFKSHSKNTEHMRMLLNYVQYEELELSDELREYVLYEKLPSRSLFGKKKNISKGTGDESKVRNILNSVVDGAVLCNSACEIEIFNPAAQKMFNCKQSDTLGTSLTSLFDRNNRDELSRLISELIQSTLTTKESQGETVDLDCLRKNQTKFPAKVNLFSTLFDNKPVITCFIKDVTNDKKQLALLAEEKKKSENLLRSILPESVASRLKSGDTFIAEKFDDMTCFFSDMVGFTKMSSTLNPTQLVGMLNNVVNGFDALIDKHNLEKIKTIGDAYFCVGGIKLSEKDDHPERTLKFAIDVFQVVRSYNEEHRLEFGHQINIRIGLNTGESVAGVIGTKKFAYDLWGDAVNTASRMESTSLSGRIQISLSTYERVKHIGFEFEERSVEVKGKGLCNTYLLSDKHHVKAVVEDEIFE
ncbi:predicted protein [Naegleria gruberi]|uniref:Predicted protein n=1 Tax=Naegleria gruberi TaxID=5762 RepID=D2VUD8_NAEGR|nr:uncharacterized protein NAEGRDRAFT_72627 [Naegleria gruberi]EFC39675.1 predicted protein [Naegleria gruberi]|eukprot:XP_002672419.1 predicted protein [Naegleria gruberi strain NEG-M]